VKFFEKSQPGAVNFPLVPFIADAVWASTHNLGQALAYSIAVPAVALVLSIFLMPETRGMRIWRTSEATAGR
jgi:hypothetical protein